MDEKILVTKSFLPPFEEYTEEIRGLWDSHWITNMGTEHEKLEKELRQYLKAENVCLFQNGHLALELSLQALGLKGEIITTPFTFASTTWAILRAGCIPVFCDVLPGTCTMDPDKIESLITERTCAILPVHVYGNLCEVDAIQEIADRHGLKVIYDAAHAFGVFRNGVSSASFGDLSMFSFHATKVFHTIEGGCVCFRDPDLKDRLFRIKNFGIQENETWGVGGNAKMNEFEAAMGVCNLRHLEEQIRKRKAVAERYTEHLSGRAGIRFPDQPQDVKRNYAYFPVFFDTEQFGESRDELCARLNRAGIFPRKYFWPCTNDFAFEREIRKQPGIPNAEQLSPDLFDPAKTPVAKRLSEQVLTLPVYGDLDLAVVDRICELILNRAE